MTPVRVAAGILIRSDGRFLLTQRPKEKVYGGYWEFPGGKSEADETLPQTLRRELLEELDIEIAPPKFWRSEKYHYPHAYVELNFFLVTYWRGEIRGRENQAFSWIAPPVLSVAPVLPANEGILSLLFDFLAQDVRKSAAQ
ncbi:MAG: (deoxy)nucleoside triphosphate pyrophosphohydrolase [Burkholderiales bacterium]|jgi:8-oxo-dGTP diphosphatase|nr:(deoxy)nucleoside triphosphate pyrophosphohydrolase [Burkholderiales bacterium]